MQVHRVPGQPESDVRIAAAHRQKGIVVRARTKAAIAVVSALTAGLLTAVPSSSAWAIQRPVSRKYRWSSMVPSKAACAAA